MSGFSPFGSPSARGTASARRFIGLKQSEDELIASLDPRLSSPDFDAVRDALSAVPLSPPTSGGSTDRSVLDAEMAAAEALEAQLNDLEIKASVVGARLSQNIVAKYSMFVDGLRQLNVVRDRVKEAVSQCVTARSTIGAVTDSTALPGIRVVAAVRARARAVAVLTLAHQIRAIRAQHDHIVELIGRREFAGAAARLRLLRASVFAPETSEVLTRVHALKAPLERIWRLDEKLRSAAVDAFASFPGMGFNAAVFVDIARAFTSLRCVPALAEDVAAQPAAWLHSRLRSVAWDGVPPEERFHRTVDALALGEIVALVPPADASSCFASAAEAVVATVTTLARAAFLCRAMARTYPILTSAAASGTSAPKPTETHEATNADMRALSTLASVDAVSGGESASTALNAAADALSAAAQSAWASGAAQLDEFTAAATPASPARDIFALASYAARATAVAEHALSVAAGAAPDAPAPLTKAGSGLSRAVAAGLNRFATGAGAQAREQMRMALAMDSWMPMPVRVGKRHVRASLVHPHAEATEAVEALLYRARTSTNPSKDAGVASIDGAALWAGYIAGESLITPPDAPTPSAAPASMAEEEIELDCFNPYTSVFEDLSPETFYPLPDPKRVGTFIDLVSAAGAAAAAQAECPQPLPEQSPSSAASSAVLHTCRILGHQLSLVFFAPSRSAAALDAAEATVLTYIYGIAAAFVPAEDTTPLLAVPMAMPSVSGTLPSPDPWSGFPVHRYPALAIVLQRALSLVAPAASTPPPSKAKSSAPSLVVIPPAVSSAPSPIASPSNAAGPSAASVATTPKPSGAGASFSTPAASPMPVPSPATGATPGSAVSSVKSKLSKLNFLKAKFGTTSEKKPAPTDVATVLPAPSPAPASASGEGFQFPPANTPGGAAVSVPPARSPSPTPSHPPTVALSKLPPFAELAVVSLTDSSSLCGFTERVVAVRSAIFLAAAFAAARPPVDAALPAALRPRLALLCALVSAAASDLARLMFRALPRLLVASLKLRSTIAGLRWDPKVPPQAPHPYTDTVVELVTKIEEACNRDSALFPPEFRTSLRSGLSTEAGRALVNAAGTVLSWNRDGRAALALDVTVIRSGIERVTKSRPAPGWGNVNDYASSFYLSERDFLDWLRAGARDGGFSREALLSAADVGPGAQLKKPQRLALAQRVTSVLDDLDAERSMVTATASAVLMETASETQATRLSLAPPPPEAVTKVSSGVSITVAESVLDPGLSLHRAASMAESLGESIRLDDLSPTPSDARTEDMPSKLMTTKPLERSASTISTSSSARGHAGTVTAMESLDTPRGSEPGNAPGSPAAATTGASPEDGHADAITLAAFAEGYPFENGSSVASPIDEMP